MYTDDITFSSSKLINIIEDKDGFMRRYYVFLPLEHENNKLYMTSEDFCYLNYREAGGVTNLIIQEIATFVFLTGLLFCLWNLIKFFPLIKQSTFPP